LNTAPNNQVFFIKSKFLFKVLSIEMVLAESGLVRNFFVFINRKMRSECSAPLEFHTIIDQDAKMSAAPLPKVEQESCG
jgi:hypothetical protein